MIWLSCTPGGRLGPSVCSTRSSGMLPMLCAITLTLLAPVSLTHQRDVLAQVGLGLLGALAVVAVAGERRAPEGQL